MAIARVYEGDHSPVLKKLLEEEVLAVAAKEGNRWLASWAFWMLNRKDMAVRALIVSPRVAIVLDLFLSSADFVIRAVTGLHPGRDALHA